MSWGCGGVHWGWVTVGWGQFGHKGEELVEFHVTAMGPSGKDCLEGNFILHNDSLFQLPKIKYFSSKYISIKSQTFWVPIV